MMFESTPQPSAAPTSTSSEPNSPFKLKLTSKHERQGSPTRSTSAMRALQPHIIAHTVRTQILKYMIVEDGKVKPERSIKQSKVSTQARQHTIPASQKAQQMQRTGMRERACGSRTDQSPLAEHAHTHTHKHHHRARTQPGHTLSLIHI